MKRIALVEINQESNSFTSNLCNLEDFKNNYLYHGEDMIKFLTGSGTELGGFINRFSLEDGIKIVPIVAAHAVPSGVVEKDTINYLIDEVIQRLSLEKNESLDGIGMVLHGAMVGEHIDDFEGYLLEEVRNIVGNDIPIVASLDLHAHLTEKMVSLATALIGYRHYPHDDTFETGYKAADLLIQTIQGKVKPLMSLIKVPMILPVNNMQTFEGPMKSLLDEESRIDKIGPILSASIFPVQAWLDIPHTGFACLVVTDNHEKYGKEYSLNLAKMAWKLRNEFIVKTYSVEEVIKDTLKLKKKPILLVDSADSIGGGAPGDSIHILQKLLEMDVNQPSVLSIVNPSEAQRISSYKIGDTVSINLASTVNQKKEKISVTGKVQYISNGKFLYKGGIFKGTEGSMGKSALVSVGNISIVLVSHGTYEWDDTQYRTMGVELEKMKYIVVKMPMNYKITYRHIVEDIYVLDTPGPMHPDLKKLPFKRITRPLFPFDNIHDDEMKIILDEQAKIEPLY